MRIEPLASALTLLCGAALAGCAPLPTAELSQTAAPAVVVEAPPTGPCAAEHFDACTDACSTRECLLWCGGDSCVAIARDLHECAAPGEEQWLAANPEPELEYIPPGPDAPEGADYEMPTEESELAQMEWNDAWNDALYEHWEAQCQPRCAASFPDEEDPELAGEYCQEYAHYAYEWDDFAAPPPKPEPEPETLSDEELAMNSGILGALGDSSGMFSSGLFGASMLGGGSISVESPANFEHGYALNRLVDGRGALRAADECVPELEDGSSETFALTLNFDEQGRAQVVDGDAGSEAAQCIAQMVETQVSIPPLAARGLPPLSAEVHVSPDTMAGVGGLIGDDANMWGDSIGESYGVGGFGLSGTGEGGGGTGEGSIGIGGLGSGGGRGGGGSAGSLGSGTGSGGGGGGTVADIDTDDD